MKIIKFLLVGILLGIIMFKSEAASWFRIYEMFRFESFHMYGIIGSTVVLGIIFIQLIKKYNIKSFYGNEIHFQPKNKSFARYILGGIIFGLGWALVGACPAPIFTLIGAGFFPVIIVFIFSILGTFLYGVLKNKLPH